MNELDDLTGKRFGRWTVLYQSDSKFKTRMTMWHCRCDCGTEKDIGRSNLVNGKTKSCGCYRKEKSQKLDETKRKYDQQGNIIQKLCPMCREFKPVSEFKVSHRKIDGYSEYCGDCLNYSLKRRYARYNKRARNVNMKFDISKSDFDRITKQPCHYCGGYSVKYQGNVINGIDRVNSKLGYVSDNIVPCCVICNRMKLDYEKEDWINHMKQILTHLEENNE